MLQLRSVADGRFDSPLQMIEEFLRQLAGKIGADRAALFLAPQDSGAGVKALVRSGEAFQTGVRDAWQKHEDTLARSGFALQEVGQFNAESLGRIGINNLLGAAL